MAHIKQAHNESNGSWLSSNGPYQTTIEQCIALNPGLMKADPRNEDMETRAGTSRLVLIELPYKKTNGDETVQRAFETASEVEAHFEEQVDPSIHRVYLLEGLDPDFVQLVG